MDEYVSTTEFNNAPATQKGTSGLAIASLVCSLVVCCPGVTSLVAIVLGIAAFFTTGAGRKGGRGLAIAGMSLGLIGLIAWGMFASFAGSMVVQIMESPNTVMREAYAGNDTAVAAEFASGKAPTPAEIQAFVAEAKARYGEFEEMIPGEQNQNSQGQLVEFPYTMKFENDTVEGLVDFQFLSLSDGFQLISITIQDSKQGDIVLKAGGAKAEEASGAEEGS